MIISFDFDKDHGTGEAMKWLTYLVPMEPWNVYGRGLLITSCMLSLRPQDNIHIIHIISSNNSRGRLFLFSHQKGAIIRGKAINRGRRLFQIFLTGGFEKVKYMKRKKCKKTGAFVTIQL